MYSRPLAPVVTTGVVLDHFDWVVREDEEGHVIIRMAGGGRIRITNDDAEALRAGLQHLKNGGTVHLNRRPVAKALAATCNNEGQ